MKKRHYLVLMAILAGMTVFSGCGDQKQENKAETKTETEAESEKSTQEETAGYNVEDYVTLGDYKNLAVQYPIPEVTEEDVESYIEDILIENTEYNEVDRAAQNGDSVNIDYTGTIDGEEFEGGGESDYDLVLGEGEFLEDFENNLIGKKAGEEVVFSVVFPDDYDEYLELEEGEEGVAGKTAEFTVNINSVSEVITPEYNEELIQQVSDCSTKEEYEESIKEELMAGAEQDSLLEAKESALSLAVENASVEGYPQELYDSVYAETEESYEMFAEMFGSEVTDEEVEDATLWEVEETLVVQAIAKAEGIEITDEEYQADGQAMAEEEGYDTLEELETDYGKEYIQKMMLREKVMDVIYDAAEVEEVTQDVYYEEEEEEE